LGYKGKVPKPSYECQRCGKALSNPVSVSRGVGPICERRIGVSRGGGSQEFKQQLLRRARDQAVNRTLQKVEACAVLHQPHLALAIEGVRQAYNHRDYIYDVCKELSSERPIEEKLEKLKERTTQEMKAEVTGYMVSGGSDTVSLHLSRLGLFDKPFGPKGLVLDERTSRLFQDFFESSLAELIQTRASI
jgi:hypothetical protein